MALLFFTGFENEDGYEGDYVEGIVQSATQKRSGNYSAYSSSSIGYLRHDISGVEVTFILGGACFVNTNSSWWGLILSNDVGVQASVYARAYGDGSGRVVARRGDWNGTTLQSGTKPIYTQTWYYIETKITINNSTGSVIVNIDEVEDINISGVNTQQQAAATVTNAKFGMPTAGYFYMDDLYVCDTTGSVNNDFLGPVRVEGLQPSGNGYNSDFVGSDADSTDNYLHVDEVPADDDTSYIKSSTNGHIDSFALGNLTGSVNSIKGIKVNSVAKVSDTFARNYKNLVRVNGTNYLGSDNNPDTSYNNNFDIWEEDPDTATGWTETGVNAIEVGVEITS